MKTQIAVISAILGTMILGKGIWQYIHEKDIPPNGRVFSRENVQLQTRIQKFLEEKRAKEQERRLTQRLRQLHNTTIRR
jgi:hypothetical protein